MSELDQSLRKAAAETRSFVESTVDLDADLSETLTRSQNTAPPVVPERPRRLGGTHVALGVAAALVVALVGVLTVIDRDARDVEPVGTIISPPSPTPIVPPSTTISDLPIMPASTVATPTSTTTANGAPVSNGWIAGLLHDESFLDTDIYLARQGVPAQRIVGSDTDNEDQRCPAMSPDGARLAFGQATGNWEIDYQDAAVVITDLSADGSPSAITTFAVDGMPRPPCPIWSPDGQMIAFGAGTMLEDCDTGVPALGCSLVWPNQSDEVWILDTETGDIRKLTGLSATDIDWAPDSSELFIASDGILAYSLADDETRQVGDTSGVLFVAVSPDGLTLAAQHGGRLEVDGEISAEPVYCCDDPVNLWLIDTDGTDRRTLVSDYRVMSGIGPAWSPDGSRIVFQKLCITPTVVNEAGEIEPCNEQSNAVVVSVSDTDPLGARGTQTVIPYPVTTYGDTTAQWYPSSVVWSPDSTTLLYDAWSFAFDRASGEAVNRGGQLAVRVDGATAPVVVHEHSQEYNVRDSLPSGDTSPNTQSLPSAPSNAFQRWGRSPD